MNQAPVNAFQQYAAEMRPLVDAALDRLSRFDDDCPPQLRDAIRHSLMAPGKRLRPLLVLMAADACGCDSSRAMPAACAVEMVHTYSLIHDDLPAMDDDSLRRGLPTCHAKYGEALAILAGDALLARAFEVLALGEVPANVVVQSCRELAQAAGAGALVGGQVDDLAAEFQPLGIEELERIHRRKTGALFTASLRLGGLWAIASDAQLESLQSFGRCLGLAFQIVDDLLDLEGDPAAMGKQTQKDSGHGKLTFPAILGVDESRRRAAQLVDDACRALAPFGERGQTLAAIAGYVLQRKQ